MNPNTISCWEPTEIATPIMGAARDLYERTIDRDERIPWSWIERAIGDPAPLRPSGWSKHLILASEGPDRDDPRSLVGFAYGAFIPGFGGYLCYLGVSPDARRKGVGSRLLDAIVRAMAVDAVLAGESLPFVLWESYRPTDDDAPALQEMWEARLRTFDRAGAKWIEGVQLATPDYGDEDAEGFVPLQLFLKPVDEAENRFTPERLTVIVQQLLEKVYHEKPGDYYHDATVATIDDPRLVPTCESSLAWI